MDAAVHGSSNLFSEMKRIKGKSKGNKGLPNTVGNANGERQIANEFKNVYSALYNSSSTKNELKLLKDTLQRKIRYESYSDANMITGLIVKNAACKLKPNKGDVSESFSSDAILNAPDIFFDFLAAFYRSWLVHGTVSPCVLSCAFIPLYKGGLKDPASTDSYRAIACSSLLLKLFDNVVISLWGHLLSTDSLQFGFKKGTSTTECSWLALETANYFVRKGTP